MLTMVRKDFAIYEEYWKQMKKEVEQGTAPHSWGKEFVQSNYGKHGVDEAGAIYTAYPLHLSLTLFLLPVTTSTLDRDRFLPVLYPYLVK